MHGDASWGKWLHYALEDYRIDRDLVGRETPVGPVPKTLQPIFRDREDFSAGHSLTEQTLAADREDFSAGSFTHGTNARRARSLVVPDHRLLAQRCAE